jgi:hypothetical protein
MCETVAITFGDAGENHVGMQKVGSIADSGFTREDLMCAKKFFEDRCCKCEWVDLGRDENAAVLIIRDGVECLLGLENGADLLYEEQCSFERDTKAFMYGRVVNKHARHNVCFGETAQEPDYEQKKGRIMAFKDLPYLDMLRSQIEECMGEKGKGMIAEGNYYYDSTKCGIGYHGDAERRRVIACKLASNPKEKMYLHYQWFKDGEPVGENTRLTLYHGDIYIMGEKAVGWDWKKKSIYTLRHAAGCAKFTDVTK